MPEKSKKSGLEEAVSEFAPDQADELGAQERSVRAHAAIEAGGGLSMVSRRAGIPISTLKRYQDGQEMRLSAALALAEACGVRLSWLANGQGPMRAGQTPDEGELDLDVSSLAGMLEAVEKGMPDARPKARLEAALLVHEALRRQVRSLPPLDIDVELLAGCLTLIEELARLRGRPRATAYSRVKAALGAYRHYIAEEAENPASDAAESP